MHIVLLTWQEEWHTLMRKMHLLLLRTEDSPMNKVCSEGPNGDGGLYAFVDAAAVCTCMILRAVFLTVAMS